MFYFPGSLFVGRIIEIAVSIEIFPWQAPDWNDDDRRGAGSIVIGLGLVVGIGLGVARLAGAL